MEVSAGERRSIPVHDTSKAAFILCIYYRYTDSFLLALSLNQCLRKTAAERLADRIIPGFMSSHVCMPAGEILLPGHM